LCLPVSVLDKKSREAQTRKTDSDRMDKKTCVELAIRCLRLPNAEGPDANTK
jgi:hypothetical protein